METFRTITVRPSSNGTRAGRPVGWNCCSCGSELAVGERAARALRANGEGYDRVERGDLVCRSCARERS